MDRLITRWINQIILIEQIKKPLSEKLSIASETHDTR